MLRVRNHHSSDGLADVDRVLFQNDDGRQQYGAPRSQAEYQELLSLLTEVERENRRSWLLKTLQVGQRQNAHICGAADFARLFVLLPSYASFELLRAAECTNPGQTITTFCGLSSNPLHLIDHTAAAGLTAR